MFLEIGKINKPHGLQGELKAQVEDKFLADISEAEAFFIELKGTYTPYFIEYIRGKGRLLLKLEDVDNKESAAFLTNKKLYLRREDIQLTDAEIDDRGLEYQFIEGFVLFDEQVGRLGIIESVEEFPQQEMAIVLFQEKQCLIPLNALWIVQIDEASKEITMNLPEGLIDI